MLVYATSRNLGAEPLKLMYLGTSFSEAVEAVGDFTRYRKAPEDFPKEFVSIYSALPSSVVWEFTEYYSAYGKWYSIVEFELEAVPETGIEESLQEETMYRGKCFCGWISPWFFTKDFAERELEFHRRGATHN